VTDHKLPLHATLIKIHVFLKSNGNVPHVYSSINLEHFISKVT